MTYATTAVMRRLLVLDSAAQTHRLRTLYVDDVRANHDPRQDHLLLWGEALCQAILRDDPAALIIARGPLVFLPGNKATVGYLSPLTGLPHYSFVGGQGFAQLFHLGLDALVLTGGNAQGGSFASHYAVVSGRAPDLDVAWRAAEALPGGQRAAYYHLLAAELAGQMEAGSIFTIGEGAQHGYTTANLAVDGLYHAGRGGAGYVFSRYLRALVLRGEAPALATWLGSQADAFRALRQLEIQPRLDVYADRLARRDGGTVSKLYLTGSGDRPTLPAQNARRLGYDLADLGARRVLKAHRVGQTGCQWCPVNCRHWHWVDVDYAPDGRDRYLDDFEPTYAFFAMLDLHPQGDSLQARLDLIKAVDRQVMVPVEQMGIDVIDAGVGIAALFDGLERGLIPLEDVPPGLRTGPYLGNLERVAEVVQLLRAGTTAPALTALGAGPEGLVARYPALRDVVFTCGPGTLGNPGHANALWTFLMPFSRFFSHYAGQIYKVPGELTPAMSRDEARALFERVVRTMLRREFLICLGNALSLCAFTAVMFSQDGAGEALDDEHLLARTLALYGLDVHDADLLWFAQAFWAQSMMLKVAHGWTPPRASDFPGTVFDLLSAVLERPPAALRALMDDLIDVWKEQAAGVLQTYGYDVPWSVAGG